MPTPTELADAIATLVEADVAVHGLREYYERNNVDIENDDLAKFVALDFTTAIGHLRGMMRLKG